MIRFAAATINDRLQRQLRARSIGANERLATDSFRLCWAWVLAALLLSAGCAPTIDEDARLAGIGTARAAPQPNPIPRFTGTSFVAADGQVLPLRKWLPKGAVKAVILALHGFNDYSNAFEGPGEAVGRPRDRHLRL